MSRSSFFLLLSSTGLLFNLVISSPAHAESDVDSVSTSQIKSSQSSTVEAATLDDYASFRQTVGRYKSRMQTFRDETLSIVEQVKQEQVSEISKKYNDKIVQLKDEVRVQEGTAVVRFEQFIEKYPEREESSGIMFRLAELYFDTSLEKFSQEALEADRLIDAQKELEFEPRADFAKSIDLYTRIIDLHPQSDFADSALYMLGWCHREGDSLQQDEDKAIAYFQRLVEQYPDSNFGSQANYFIGFYHFDNNDLEKSYEYYKRSFEQSDSENTFYGLSLYGLAWTEYRRSNYPNALDLFSKLLDYSELRKKTTGQHTGTREEALIYSAWSLTDQAEYEGLSSVEMANKFFNDIGDKPYEADIYEEMSQLLIKDERPEEAIEIYNYLQSHWPLAAKNPQYQMEVAKLHGYLNDLDAYNLAISQLTQDYSENGDWWKANRNNPEAQDIAKGFIEDSLMRVASNQYNNAIGSEEPEDYLQAANLYEQYLTKFPFADDYYTSLWYMAESLLSAKELDRADQHYLQLIKSGEQHDYLELASVRRSFVLLGLVETAMAGDFGTVPAEYELDPENVERVEKLRETTQVTVGKQEVFKWNEFDRNIFKLPQLHHSFIKSYQTMIGIDFDAKIADLQERATNEKDPEKRENLELQALDIENAKQFVANARVNYEYNIGQLLTTYGRYIDAKEWLNNVITLDINSLESYEASKVILGALTAQRNWETIASETQRFIDQGLGGEDGIAFYLELQMKSRKLFTQGLLADAQELLDDGQIQDAGIVYSRIASEYQRFLIDYPSVDDNERSNIMLLTANNYESAGNLAQANIIYRDYVDRYPERQEARALIFAIASNHQDALEYEEAIKYYEILYNQTHGKGIDYPDAVSALYNAALLKVGLGQYENAAKGLEKYVNTFPEQLDAEETFFSAGQYWEKISPWKSLEFYRRYLKNYAGTNPDRTMMAYRRRIKIYNELGKKKNVAKEWAALIKGYEQMLAKGDDSELMRRYAAENEIRLLQARLDEFDAVKPSKKDNRNLELIPEMIEKKNNLVSYCLDLSTKYRDLEALLAGRYCAGFAELKLAEFLQEVPPPSYFDDNAIIVFEDKIGDLLTPLEDGGQNALRGVLEAAEKREIWTDWSEKALNYLSLMDAESYPKMKGLIRTEQAGSYIPTLGPISYKSSTALRTNNQVQPEDANETEPSNNEVGSTLPNLPDIDSTDDNQNESNENDSSDNIDE